VDRHRLRVSVAHFDRAARLRALLVWRVFADLARRERAAEDAARLQLQAEALQSWVAAFNHSRGAAHRWALAATHDQRRWFTRWKQWAARRLSLRALADRVIDARAAGLLRGEPFVCVILLDKSGRCARVAADALGLWKAQMTILAERRLLEAFGMSHAQQKLGKTVSSAETQQRLTRDYDGCAVCAGSGPLGCPLAHPTRATGEALLTAGFTADP
jgi:hypothetical protein